MTVGLKPLGVQQANLWKYKRMNHQVLRGDESCCTVRCLVRTAIVHLPACGAASDAPMEWTLRFSAWFISEHQSYATVARSLEGGGD